jgi:hypothetical protein
MAAVHWWVAESRRGGKVKEGYEDVLAMAACGKTYLHSKATTDPRAVTCSLCLRNKTLREILSPWHSVVKVDKSFLLNGSPESPRRQLLIITIPLTPEQVHVICDLLLQYVPQWLRGPPDKFEIDRMDRRP